MTTINIKFDEKQLEDVVKKVTEKLKEDKKNNFYELSNTAQEEPKKEQSLMYLEFNEASGKTKKNKVYFGYVFNTLSKSFASTFDLNIRGDLNKVNELKSQGWKEEVVYK